MERVSISTFKATCLALLERVRRTGQPILITRRGEPIAEVVPPPKTAEQVRWLGSLSDTGRVDGDLIEPAARSSDWEALIP